MSVYTLPLPLLPVVIIRKHLTVIPQIYRLSLALPHSLEVSLKTKGLCCGFVLCVCSPWGWNKRLIPFKQVNRKGCEILKGFYICHVTRKPFLLPVEFYTKCISPKNQLLYLFLYLYTYIGIYWCRYLFLNAAENSRPEVHLGAKSKLVKFSKKAMLCTLAICNISLFIL